MFSLMLQADPSLYTNNVTLVVGVALLGLLGIWYYRLQKANPELDFGPLVATSMVDKHETIFMFIVFMEYIMTALVASTVHKPDSTGIEMSPLGRVGLHIVLSLTGTVAQFTLARDIAILFIRQKPGELTGNALATIVILLLAMGVPYANLLLIASSTGESIPFQMWLYSISPFTDNQEMAAMLYSFGYPDNYQPWENMSSVLHVCIVSAIIVHFGLTFVEAMRTMSSPKRRKMLMDRVYKEREMDEKKDDKKGSGKKSDDKKGEGDAKTEGQKRQLENVESNIKFMLRRRGYDGDKLANKTKEIATAMNNPGDKGDAEAEETMLAWAAKLSSMVLTARTIDSKETGDEKKKRNQALLKEFDELIEGDKKDKDGKLLPREKRGLGIRLANRKN